MKTASVTLLLVAFFAQQGLAATPPEIMVTRCDVILKSASPGSYQSTHGEPLHFVPGPKVYQYQARIAVANRSSTPLQFVRVDVRGITRSGATVWAPISGYFPVVLAHGTAGVAGDPLITSRRMSTLDADRPVRGFHCVQRGPGPAPDSTARPIDE